MNTPLRFRVYSDYLCPWCANAAQRLEVLEREYGGRVVFDWRAYLLRPQPRKQPRDSADQAKALLRFTQYTESWKRPAAEPDGFSFQTWQSQAGPPSHSIPAHLVAKAAGRLGSDALAAIHAALLRAYFTHSRDISDGETLAAVWAEQGLPAADFALREDPELLREVLSEHDEAIGAGVTGVPAVLLEGNDAVIVGAQPLELYRRWIDRALARQSGRTDDHQ